MGIAEFETLLKQTMGLDAASIGASAIERAVQERLSACALKDAYAYWEHVRASATELQELIEAVVIPETWFFRDREAFAAVAGLAQEEWPKTHPADILRLLSLPCSTGEEPYSMAMALMDAGFPLNRFHIDAVDISLRALTHAQRAVYGKNSFRGNNLAFRDRHFQPTPHGYRLDDNVRGQVQFQQGNLFDGKLLPGTGIYEVIFCRNVLIYFDRATQEKALKVLMRLLTPNGLLFVGPSETGLLLAHDFISAKIPLAFAFRKPAPTHYAPIAGLPRTAKRLPIPERPLRAPPSFKPMPKPASPLAITVKPVIGIEEAERLANQGRLAEAQRHCEKYLREHGPSARAFYLLGLVHDAADEYVEAREFYRKALYLNPNHQEALLQLALLFDKLGDSVGAKVMRQRAQRLMSK